MSKSNHFDMDSKSFHKYILIIFIGIGNVVDPFELIKNYGINAVRP